MDRGAWACLRQQLRKYLLLPCSLEQSGCILFVTLECLLSPLGEGELHWMSAQLENCPASSSLAVRWAVHTRLIHDKMTSHNQRNVKRLIKCKSRFKEVKCSPFTWRTLAQRLVACKNSCRLQIMCEHERSPRRAHTRLILTAWWDRGTSLGRPWKGCGLWLSVPELRGWELASSVLGNPIATLPHWNKWGPTPWPKTQRPNGACRLSPEHHFSSRCIAEIC